MQKPELLLPEADESPQSRLWADTSERCVPPLCELVTQSCPTPCDPMDCNCQDPLSMGSPRSG